jgi:hypothetical protein
MHVINQHEPFQLSFTNIAYSLSKKDDNNVSALSLMLVKAVTVLLDYNLHYSYLYCSRLASWLCYRFVIDPGLNTNLARSILDSFGP